MTRQDRQLLARYTKISTIVSTVDSPAARGTQRDVHALEGKQRHVASLHPGAGIPP